jgi:hypothetical protein
LNVGDRIRPDTQRLADLLQERVTLGFTFGLLEMPVYDAADGLGYVVQPRVVLRTEVVKRTVFVATGSGPEHTCSPPVSDLSIAPSERDHMLVDPAPLQRCYRMPIEQKQGEHELQDG